LLLGPPAPGVTTDGTTAYSCGRSRNRGFSLAQKNGRERGTRGRFSLRARICYESRQVTDMECRMGIERRLAWMAARHAERIGA